MSSNSNLPLFNLPNTKVITGEEFLKNNYKAKVPRYRCFALSDFHDFDRCSFRFFVKHHLGKKYELEEGTPNQALGSLLDLTIKKIHQHKLYKNTEDDLINIVKASEAHMREKALKEGPFSYFGPQIPFLTPELIKKTQDILRNYLQGFNSNWQPTISEKTFWQTEVIATDGEVLKLWGGPDLIELGKDGVPEVVDFKYFEDQEKGKNFLDMELMPKLYVLLTSLELKQKGYKTARFKVRFWQDPKDESFYEEYDLLKMDNILNFFQQKAESILRTIELSFCEKDYCKVCKHESRPSWLKVWEDKSWLN